MISFTYETDSLFLLCFVVTVLNVIILLGEEEIVQTARFYCHKAEIDNLLYSDTLRGAQTHKQPVERMQ